jgi:hypothetical protein
MGRRAERRNRGERGRTASPPGQWLWQGRVRAEENQRLRSPRCAEQAGGGRFLATEERNTASRIAFGGAARGALVLADGLTPPGWYLFTQTNPYPRVAVLAELVFGAILGTVDLIECVPLETVEGQPYANGPWCWFRKIPGRYVGPCPSTSGERGEGDGCSRSAFRLTCGTAKAISNFSRTSNLEPPLYFPEDTERHAAATHRLKSVRPP